MKKLVCMPDEVAEVAGVCAGLAYRFKFPVLLVRLAFALAALAGFGGLAAYIVLWILMDEADEIPDDYEEATS